MGLKFIKKIEDFRCEKCGKFIKGNGYTNHCPYCLYSKHVDINPGDRKSNCCGLMAPKGIETKKGRFIIIHACERCGFVKKNTTSEIDSFEEIMRISKNQIYN